MTLRIAHFTDLHFTDPPSRWPGRWAFSKRLIGWSNLRFLGRYGGFTLTDEVVRAFVADVGEQAVDGIVFTGDVTGLSLPTEFERARDSLDPLRNDPRVVGIPGNHDVYLASDARANLFAKHFGDWQKTDLKRQALSPAAALDYPYPLVRHLDDGGSNRAAIIALKDARPVPPHDSSGRVSRAQLVALKEILAQPEIAESTVILALHYCLRRPDGSRDTYLHRLRNDREVARVAAEGGVDVVVAGHIHHRVVFARGALLPFALTNPGSLSMDNRDRAYHVLAIERGQIHLKARRFDPTEGRFVAWDDAPGVGPIA